MSDSQTASIQEFVQAEIALPQTSLAIEQAALAAIVAREGVESATVANGQATVCYDPLRVTQADLSELLSPIAGTPKVEAHRTSPLADLEPHDAVAEVGEPQNF